MLRGSAFLCRRSPGSSTSYTKACHLLFSSALFKVGDQPGQKGLSADVAKLERKLKVFKQFVLEMGDDGKWVCCPHECIRKLTTYPLRVEGKLGHFSVAFSVAS